MLSIFSKIHFFCFQKKIFFLFLKLFVKNKEPQQNKIFSHCLKKVYSAWENIQNYPENFNNQTLIVFSVRLRHRKIYLARSKVGKKGKIQSTTWNCEKSYLLPFIHFFTIRVLASLILRRK